MITKLSERIKPIEMAKSTQKQKQDTQVIFKRKVPEGIVNIKPALKKLAMDQSGQGSAQKFDRKAKPNRSVSFQN